MTDIPVRLGRRFIARLLTVLLAFLVPLVRWAFGHPEGGALTDILVGTIGIAGFSLSNLVDLLVFTHPTMPPWARFVLTFASAVLVCFAAVGLVAASVSLLSPDVAITSTGWYLICGGAIGLSVTMEAVIALKQ